MREMKGLFPKESVDKLTDRMVALDGVLCPESKPVSDSVEG